MKANFLYYLSSTIIINFLGIILITPILTYYLDATDFGILAIITAITSFISPLSSVGIVWILSGNYFTLDDKERKSLIFNIISLDFGLKIIIVVFFVLICKLILPYIIKEYHSDFDLYFNYSVISVLLSSIWANVSYILVLQNRARMHSILEIGQWIICNLIIISCLVFFKMKTVSLFIGPLVQGFFIFIYCVWFIRKESIMRFDKKWIKEIIRLGFPSILVNTTSMLSNLSDRYFIQWWLDLKQLGLYSFALKYRVAFTLGTKSFTRTFSPLALDVYSNNNDEKELKNNLKLWYGVSGVLGTCIILFSAEIIQVLTHDKFTSTAPMLSLFFLIVIISNFDFPYNQFLLAKKKTKYLMFNGITNSIISIILVGTGTYFFGLYGSIAGFLFTSLLLVFLKRRIALKLGCKKIGDSYFLYSLLLNLILFFFIYFLMVNVIIKFILLIIFLTIYILCFDLWKKLYLYINIKH